MDQPPWETASKEQFSWECPRKTKLDNGSILFPKDKLSNEEEMLSLTQLNVDPFFGFCQTNTMTFDVKFLMIPLIHAESQGMHVYPQRRSFQGHFIQSHLGNKVI